MSSVTEFGKDNEGKLVHKITFFSPNKQLRCSVITFGGTIQSLQVHDPTTSKFVEVTLGFETLEQYLNAPGHIGATVGRYANRIKDAQFPRSYLGAEDDNSSSNGNHHMIQLKSKNNNDRHNLHGGPRGFSRRPWDSFELIHPQSSSSSSSESKQQNEAAGDAIGVTLKISSPDGEEGFPGAVSFQADFYFNAKNQFVMDWSAVSSGATTIFSATNHAYYNLHDGNNAPLGSVMNHTLHIPHGRFYLPVDNYAIPSGEIRSVVGTPLDFCTKPKALAERAEELNTEAPSKPGYDNCLVLGGPTPINSLRHACTLIDPVSKRAMRVDTSLPGLQIYSANFLPQETLMEGRKDGGKFGCRSGLCLETNFFPDSPNNAHFPSVLLVPGQVWRHRTVHSFLTAA